MASGEVVEALELPSYDEASGKGKVYGILVKDVSRMMSGLWVETVLRCFEYALPGRFRWMFGCCYVWVFAWGLSAEVLFFSGSPLLRLRG